MDVRLELLCVHFLLLSTVLVIQSFSVKAKPTWESYEPAPGNDKPPRRTGHASVTHGDRIIMFVAPRMFSSLFATRSADLAALTVDNTTMTHGCSMSRDESGLSCNVLSTSLLREGHATALVDNVMYVFGGRGVDGTDLSDLTAFKLSSEWGGTVYFPENPSLFTREKKKTSSAMVHSRKYGAKSYGKVPCNGFYWDTGICARRRVFCRNRYR